MMKVQESCEIQVSTWPGGRAGRPIQEHELIETPALQILFE